MNAKEHLRKNILIACQQAVEYIVKAYLTHKKIYFRRIHEISYLQECLKPADESLANSLEVVVGLDSFSGKNRYPDHDDIELNKSLVQGYFIKSQKVVDLFLSELEKESGSTYRNKKDKLGIFFSKVEGLSDRFTYNGNYVTLDSYLPEPNSVHRGCCAIRLEHTAIRGGNITFTNEEIISQLLIGLGSSYNSELRQFIVGKNNGDYTIQLNNVRATIDERYVAELCQAVDKFAEVYFQRLLDIENKLECRFFYLSKESLDGYRMFGISRGIWNLMRSYGREFDLDKGNTDWHIFDSRMGVIHIYPNGKNDIEFYFSVYAEETQTEQVMLSWRGKTPKKNNHFWTVERVSCWLQEQFIPHVLYWHYRNRNKYNIFKKNYEKFKGGLDLEDHISFDSSAKWLGLEQTNSDHHLKEYVEWMQINFHGEDRFHMNREAFKHLISAIEICLRLFPDEADEWKYIAGNLGFHGEPTKKSILTFLKELKNNGVLEEFINPNRVDFYSRSLFACFDRMNYPQEVQSEVKNELAHIEKHLRRVELINKYLRKTRL